MASYRTKLASQVCWAVLVADFCFYAVQPKWIERDRFYKVYATGDALFGAWLAGELCTWRAALANLLIFAPLAYWPLKLRDRREARYDRLISQPDQFLAHDRRNFVVPAWSIRAAQPTQRFKTWRLKLGRSSTLTIELYDGTPFDLIVMPPETAEDVANRLREFGYLREFGCPCESFTPTAALVSEDGNPYRAPQFGR